MGLAKDYSLAIVLGFLNHLVVPYKALDLVVPENQEKVYSLFFQPH